MKKTENNNYLTANKNYENIPKKNLLRDFCNFCGNKKLILPVILALLCYSNGLYGDFVHDDIFAINRNPDVHGKTDLWSVFSHDFWGKAMHENTSHKSYRPLTVVTFRLNYAFHGLQPFYYHVVNVALHMLVSALFIYMCRWVLQMHEKCALVAGTLFAVHPIHTEAVTGIVGRAEVLAAVFFLLSFISYKKCISSSSRKMAYLWLSLVLGGAAMLSKEVGITTLGVSVVFDVVTTLGNRKDIRKHFSTNTFFQTRLLVTALFILFLLWFRVWMMAGTLPQFILADNPASFSNSTITRFFTYGYLWSLNVWLLFAPMTLCYDWQHGSVPLVESVADPRNLATVITAGIFIVVVLQAFSCLRKGVDRMGIHLCIGLTMLALPFLPASNMFFPVGFVLAERVLYIPSMGFCVLISIGFVQLFERWHRTAAGLSMLFFCLILSGKTWHQNLVWMSRESLFRSGVNTLPQNAKVHYNYGNFLKDSARFEDAKLHYREALRLDPTYASAHNNLGTLLEDRYEAETHFREALRLHPTHQGAHVNLGNLLFKRGLRDDGLTYLYRAVEIEPRNPEATTSLASCLIEQNNFTEAEIYLKTTLEISPEYKEAYIHYGSLLSKTDKYEESAKFYERAHELDRSESAALVHAAQQYRALGDIPEAELLLKRALDIRRDVNTLEQLAILYYGAGRTKDSVAVYADIERLDHNSTDTIVRHAKIVAAEGHLVNAEEMLTRALVSHPEDVGIITTSAQVKSNLQKHQEAAELLTKGIQLTLGTSEEYRLEEMYFDRGNNYKDIRKLQQALADYLEVIRLNPRHVKAHGNCGAIYHMNGILDKARYHYNKALEFDPDNEIIQNNLEKLDRLHRQRQAGVG